MSHYSTIFIVFYTECLKFYPVDRGHNVYKKEALNAIDTSKDNSKKEFHRISITLTVLIDIIIFEVVKLHINYTNLYGKLT